MQFLLREETDYLLNDRIWLLNILAENKGICIGVDFEDIRSGEYKAEQERIHRYGGIFHDSRFNVPGPRVFLNTPSSWLLETWS